MIKSIRPLTGFAARRLPENSCILDIVSSGRFWRNSRLLEIRLILGRNEETVLISEKEEDEDRLLSETASLLSEISTVITFNGVSFDMPYLHAKYKAYGLEDPLLKTECRDLLADYRYLKAFFGLPGRHLQDYFNYYMSTLSDRSSADSPDFSSADDAVKTLAILSFDALGAFLDGRYELEDAVCENDLLICTLRLKDFSYPGAFSVHDEIYHLRLENDLVRLGIHLNEKKQIRVYHTDLKNYAYLPQEGYAVHKSVAQYVDSSRKEKAVRANCFHFISYSDNLIRNRKMLEEYLQTVLQFLKSR
ncbi:MAG: ribonuclease H-like domain-containing protein [Lachnospiraceae bacterium]|nr:ribonuclease H-like domain-containing protein [Lachnospiraceae bacterium]